MRIALTHAHLDHVGSVDALVKALPDAELLISERDARFIAGDRSLDPGEQEGKPRGSWKTVEAKPTRTISGGERVGSLEVVPSPGHTPGHVAFLDTRDRTLIAGDAFKTLRRARHLRAVRPPLPPRLDGHVGPTPALESAQALRALEPSRLAVGHGSVLNAPGQAMDLAIARGSSGLGHRFARPRDQLGREAQLEAGAAARLVDRRGRGAVRLRHLAHDREAEAGARHSCGRPTAR